MVTPAPPWIFFCPGPEKTPPGLDRALPAPHHGPVFVRLVGKGNGRVSVRVVENVKEGGRVRQRVVCHVGQARGDDAGTIESHRRAGEAMIVRIRNGRRPVLPGFEEAVHAPRKRRRPGPRKGGAPEGDPREDGADARLLGRLEEESRIRLGVADVHAGEYERLGLLGTIDSGYRRKEANELLRDVVLSRVDKPASKRKTVMDLARDGGREAGLDAVYRAMDKIAGREGWVKDRIGRATLSLFNEGVSVVFFDVTTLYFESFVPDGLRRSGYSKDNKVKETQVVLALMTTTEGLPLGYELFPGDTYEGGTLVGAVDALRGRLGAADVSVVADRAMFTRENLGALEERGVDFIISAKLRTMGKKMTGRILGDVEAAVAAGGEGLSSWTGEYEHGGRRLVVGWSRKRAAKDRRDRERLLERLEKKTVGGRVAVRSLVKNTGTKKYLRFDPKDKETAVLDMEKVRAAERWDGVFGVATSHPGSRTGGEELLKRYRGLWQVEDAFRVNKHDLRMRPVFHWAPRRVGAHVLICYMAYALAAMVRHKLRRAGVRMSVARIREELGYVQASVVRDPESGRRFLLPSSPTKAQKAIYGALGLDLEERVRLLGPSRS